MSETMSVKKCDYCSKEFYEVELQYCQYCQNIVCHLCDTQCLEHSAGICYNCHYDAYGQEKCELQEEYKR